MNLKSTVANGAVNGSLGNTKATKTIKKKRINPAKQWAFTMNNYPENWKELIVADGAKFVFLFAGLEIGDEGTPHLQGYLESDKKVRPIETCQEWSKKCHWEIAGKRAKSRSPKWIRQCNVGYCTKDGKWENFGQEMPRLQKEMDLLKPEQFYPWQKRLYDALMEKPDNRTILWLWEETGNVGKSAFCKYLCCKKDALLCSGKAADMKYMIVETNKKDGIFPEIVCFDVPRSSLGYISYTGMEEIKNGLFASTKYESAMCAMPNPHVVVFANERPDVSKMSGDRWVVWAI